MKFNKMLGLCTILLIFISFFCFNVLAFGIKSNTIPVNNYGIKGESSLTCSINNLDINGDLDMKGYNILNVSNLTVNNVTSYTNTTPLAPPK